ncbi:hypothetical protein C9374_007535 [Naegleria lovaniensis]|uniref:Nudix hydrolase domain-containing protein n=1 Tax=Naegleria lovaniensis TaxID=51637 RepID=A0AA88GLM1_NAELO|nr:uncharacterized protein C9374_007535 [Naegleria lovaniensis]KAG2379396.1 hypothetical protein C9374_007535 [Naegleria lovaniensis]
MFQPSKPSSSSTRQPPQLFPCPYENCLSHQQQQDHSLFSENDLVKHCLQHHARENSKQICTICDLRNNDRSLKGSRDWGFSTHLYFEHGEMATPEAKRKEEIQQEMSSKPTYSFALVIVRQPSTGKFLLVEECCSQGWWLPAGRVDPGERFEEAALRETVEEAGIQVELKNILRVEYSPFQKGGARQRIIFYAEPVEKDPVLKSVADFESVGAQWFSYDEFVNQFLNPSTRTKKLRGTEPVQWFKYVHSGKPMYPLSMLTLEGEP